MLVLFLVCHTYSWSKYWHSSPFEFLSQEKHFQQQNLLPPLAAVFWMLAPISSVTYSTNQSIYCSHLSGIYGKSYVHKLQKHFYWLWWQTFSFPYFSVWFCSMAWTEHLSLRRNFCFSLSFTPSHTSTACLEQILVLIWSLEKLIHLIKMAKKTPSLHKRRNNRGCKTWVGQVRNWICCNHTKC